MTSYKTVRVNIRRRVRSEKQCEINTTGFDGEECYRKETTKNIHISIIYVYQFWDGECNRAIKREHENELKIRSGGDIGRVTGKSELAFARQ